MENDTGSALPMMRITDVEQAAGIASMVAGVVDRYEASVAFDQVVGIVHILSSISFCVTLVVPIVLDLVDVVVI